MTVGTKVHDVTGVASCRIGPCFNGMHEFIISGVHRLPDAVALLVTVYTKIGGVTDVALLAVLHCECPMDTWP